MKLKLIAVLIAVALVFMGSVLWRTDSFVYGDRMSWVEAQTRTQTSAINHALAVELKSLQRMVTQFGPEGLQKNKVNWSSVAPYFAVASLNVSGANLEPQVFLARDNSKASNWGPEFVKSALGKLPSAGTDLRYFVKPFQDNQRGRYVAVVFIEGSKAYALFGTGENFQSLIDAQRGSLGSFSIVTTTGLTVGHSIPEYLGTVMKDDPLFQQASKGAASQGGQVIKLASGEDLYGLFEEVPRSNLWVMSSATLKEIMKGRTGLIWQFALLGVGLVLVGLAGLLWVILPVEKEKEDLVASLALAQSKAQVAPPEKKAVAADPELAQKEKLDASVRVASALAHEMRGPMTAIMGYSQMIMAQAPADEIVKSTESILRETRSARDILDKLLGYAGESVHEKINMKVEGPLAVALKPLDPLFQQKGIKVNKNLQETSTMDLHVDALAKAFTHILSKSVEALERMQKKEISIDLYEDAAGIHLDVSDSGEGIEPGNVEKIFDPFFTTRSYQQHMGLGLSLAYGILKEHGATVKVESERGKGTKVSILFVIAKQEKLADLVAPKAKEEVEEETIVVKDLPQLKRDSEHRVEAEAEYKTSQPEPKPESPLNVNIDKLLEFPDELQFIDGFNSEKTVMAPAPDEKPTIASVSQETVVIPQEVLGSEPIEESFSFGNNIVPPKGPAVQKTSKLDGYHVEIRRPGKRI